MPKVIAVANQKGGVGKTTTALNLAYEYTQLGKNVLLIDGDPQANLTRHIGVVPEIDARQYNLSYLIKAYCDSFANPSLEDEGDEIWPVAKDIIHIKNGFHLIPASRDLESDERNLSITPGTDNVIKDVVDTYGLDYDYVIIDCRPSLSALTVDALIAANSVIIPIQPEPYAIDGLAAFYNNIHKIKYGIRKPSGRKIKEGANPGLTIEGIVFVLNNDNLKLTKSAEKQIRDFFDGKAPVCTTKIPKSVKVPESANRNMSVIEHSKYNPVSLAYKALAEELLERELKNRK